MVKIKKQKIHPHKKKRDVQPKIRRSSKGVFKFILWTILVAGIGAGIVAFQYMFVDSDLFNVKNIDVRFYDGKNVLRRAGFSNIDASDVLGASIFLVDLKDFKDRIEAARPELRDIVVRRVLPDKLIVQARQRQAVAQVFGDRPYFIDKDGVFLPYINNAAEANIPLISGIRVANPSRNNEAQRDKLGKALSLLCALSENRKFSGFRTKTIDITDSRNISFFLSGKDAEKVEIKIGDGDFNKRLDMLATVLEQLGQDIDRVKYIDLRFDDPIVGPR